MQSTFHTNGVLLTALNDHDVEYLVVGGLAVQHYLPNREADDLDLLINPTRDNVENLVGALSEIKARGMNAVDVRELDSIRGNLLDACKHIPLKKYLYADIITPMKGYSFALVLRNSVQGCINSIPVRIMSCNDLIKHKEMGNFPNDARDVAALRKNCP